MEVDEPAAQLLYAHAAQIIFERDGIYADIPEEIRTRLQIMQARAAQYEVKWPYTMPSGAKIQGPFTI